MASDTRQSNFQCIIDHGEESVPDEERREAVEWAADEIERLREALRYYANKEYDSRSMSDSVIQYVADEALNQPQREE